MDRLVLTILSAGLVASARPARAQAVSDGSWRFQIAPYVWGPGVKGTVQIRQLPELKVDVPFSDIISNFDIGFLGRFEARKGDFGVAADALYLNLGVPLPRTSRAFRPSIPRSI